MPDPSASACLMIVCAFLATALAVAMWFAFKTETSSFCTFNTWEGEAVGGDEDEEDKQDDGDNEDDEERPIA